MFFEFARCADELVRPGGWVLVENVPGLLSSAGGRDFAVLVRTLGDIGFHDLAWRVLDSRYFGVPQRRRRVFIVGRRADGDAARKVLLEPPGGEGDSPAGGETRQGVAGSVADGAQTARSLTASERWDGETEDFIVGAPADADGMRTATGVPGRVDDPPPDGPRYAAMGDAVTVPVIEWLGERLLLVEASPSLAVAA